MDIEVVEIMQKNVIVKLGKVPKNLEKMRDGFMLYLQGKHHYKSTTLTDILTNTEIFNSNSKDDLKCVSNMLRWWMIVRIFFIKLIPEVFQK